MRQTGLRVTPSYRVLPVSIKPSRYTLSAPSNRATVRLKGFRLALLRAPKMSLKNKTAAALPPKIIAATGTFCVEKNKKVPFFAQKLPFIK